MFDLGCQVSHAITGWFAGLVRSALKPIFDLLGRTLLATPRLDQTQRVSGLWSASLIVANSCFVLFVVIGGFMLMGHQTVQTSYAAKDIAPRLVIGMVAANFSLVLIGKAIDLANALSAALLGAGVDPRQASALLSKAVSQAIVGDVSDANIFFVVLAIVADLLGQILVLIYVIRIMLTILLIVSAPLMTVCHALPQTEGLAKLWWRSFAGVLAIQVAQSLVFITAIRVYLSPDMLATLGNRSPNGYLDLLITICLLYVLIRIPFWISRLIWRGGIGGSPIMRTARAIAMLLIFRKVVPAMTGRHTTAKTPGRPTPRPMLPAPTGTPARPQWVQPELPLGWPTPRAEQLELGLGVPGHPAPQRQAPGPRWTQLRLPDKTAHPPRWQQTSLPIRPRYTQTLLPEPPPRRHTQPELPLSFPRPGSPQAGRSTRRAADIAALRDAEARARRRTSPSNPHRPSGGNR